MREDYDGPIFDRIIDQHTAPAVDGNYLEQPQGRICDLAPGEWLAVSPQTVSFEEQTRKIVINTYNSPKSSFSADEFAYSPIVGHLASSRRDNPELAFAVDLRRIRSYMHPTTNLRLDEGPENYVFERQRALTGATIARVAVIRYFDEVHYLGPKQFLLPTQEFIQSVDKYVATLEERKFSLRQPYFDIHATDFHNAPLQTFPEERTIHPETIRKPHATDNPTPGS